MYHITTTPSALRTCTNNKCECLGQRPSTISEHTASTYDTLPLLEIAADDETNGEEEHGTEDADCWVRVLHISATVGALGPGK